MVTLVPFSSPEPMLAVLVVDQDGCECLMVNTDAVVSHMRRTAQAREGLAVGRA